MLLGGEGRRWDRLVVLCGGLSRLASPSNTQWETLWRKALIGRLGSYGTPGWLWDLDHWLSWLSKWLCLRWVCLGHHSWSC